MVNSVSGPWLRADRPLVVGHRGQCAHIPEHTMPSLRAAIAKGAEMIEADALLSRDGELVLMHDTTIDRTTDGTGPLTDLTWAELSELDAGSWFGPAFAGLRLLRAQDLLDLARAEGIALCLEAKGDTTEDVTRVAERLARLVADNDALGWAFVSSFDHGALAAAKAAVPALLLAPERLPEHGTQTPAETVRQALALGAPVIQHRWELISPHLVDTLHDAGIAIWAWSTNDEDAVRISLALGVDAIMGDDVDLLVLHP
ncbi:glycerophosphodiester phosphodiesterase family protein [Acrocarpospora sp. B8E8]|uniref:glycerophosphodiester phosphodiesterase n=1 Tax=Acrocarpospora sp. B8E8 TaxID=3153572 RepID=UPI00325CBC52